MDERYQRGQIYTIRNITDDTLIYVGSTINMLAKRFDRHKRDFKSGKNKISLYNYIENNDWTLWYIELYEDFPCNNKKELDRREGQVIREVGTINKNIAGRTDKEWYEENKEVILEKNKKYYEDNKEKLLEKRKEKVCCEICGAFATNSHLKRHQQSKKCLAVANTSSS
jgi:hypothetical protein